MTEGKVTIANESGLHARPASKFIEFTSKYKDSQIKLSNGVKTENAKSLLKLMSLGLKNGTEATVTVEGGDEERVLAEILDFIANLEG